MNDNDQKSGTTNKSVAISEAYVQSRIVATTNETRAGLFLCTLTFDNGCDVLGFHRYNDHLGAPPAAGVQSLARADAVQKALSYFEFAARESAFRIAAKACEKSQGASVGAAVNLEGGARDGVG